MAISKTLALFITCVAACLTTSGTLGASGDASTRFSIVRLAAPHGGVSPQPVAMNSSDQVVGVAVYSIPKAHSGGSSGYRAYLFSGGRTVTLGAPPGAVESFAEGIDSKGVVAATANFGAVGSSHPARAFVVRVAAGKPQWIPLPGPWSAGKVESIAIAMSPNGDILGYSGGKRVMWKSTEGYSMRYLPAPTIFRSEGDLAFDNAHDIVADGEYPVGSHGLRYQGLLWTRGRQHRLCNGFPGKSVARQSGLDGGRALTIGEYVGPHGERNLGAMWGSANSPAGRCHGGIGMMPEILPPLPGDDRSIATSVNSSGIVVGGSDSTEPGGEGHAVLWRCGIPHDLSTMLASGSSAIDSQPIQILNDGNILTGDSILSPTGVPVPPCS